MFSDMVEESQTTLLLATHDLALAEQFSFRSVRFETTRCETNGGVVSVGREAV